jgi:hypothetical protein
MKPLWGREYKKFGVKHARKPRKSAILSRVVLVADEGGRGCCYVQFSEHLEDAVGHALPMGISPEHPAYLKIIHFGFRGLWRLYAAYLDRSKIVFLLEYGEKPEWLRNIKRSA